MIEILSKYVVNAITLTMLMIGNKELGIKIFILKYPITCITKAL
jgi:hypothetical protein